MNLELNEPADDWLSVITTTDKWPQSIATKHRWIDKRLYEEGSVFFLRRRKRELRTRYVVCKADARGRVSVTNAEIRYRKSKNVWGIFIDDTPVRHYLSLRAAKLALMPGVLDRIGAEGHRCLDPPCSAPSSKNGA